MRTAILGAVTVLVFLTIAAALPIQRNFFTVNTAPVVQTTAGSNVFVTFTQVGQTRTYRVDVPTNGASATSFGILQGTNVVLLTNGTVVTIEVPSQTNGFTSIVYSNAATFIVYATNVLSGGQLPIGTVATNGASTNAGAYLRTDGSSRFWSFDLGAGTNLNASALAGGTANATVLPGVAILTNAETFTQAQYSSASSASNSPASNEFPTAGWVRNLFNVGANYYVSQTVDTGTNTDQPNQLLYQFQSTIPLSSFRGYTNGANGNFLTNNGYIGSVVTTNTFSQLSGQIEIATYLGFVGGNSSPTLTLHAEVYYSYDKTNWYGDFTSGNQSIVSGTTNLYQWIVTFPKYTATNAAGFYVQRRLRVGTVTGGASPALVVLIGTNAVSGTSDASHVTMQSPTALSGSAFLANNQTWSGLNNNFVATGFVATNTSPSPQFPGLNVSGGNVQIYNNLGYQPFHFDGTTALFKGDGNGLTNLNASALTSGTIGATITNSSSVIQTVHALTLGGTGSTNCTVDFSVGNKFSLTLTTNCYFGQPSNIAPMQDVTIDVRQDATGGRTVNFNTNYWRFPSGQILTTTTNANSWSEISCIAGQFATNVAVIQTLNFQ